MATTTVKLQVPHAKSRQLLEIEIKLDKALLLRCLCSAHNKPHFDMNRVDKSVWYGRTPWEAIYYISYLIKYVQPHMVIENKNKNALPGTLLLYYDDPSKQCIGHVNCRRGSSSFADCRPSHTLELRLKSIGANAYVVIMAYPSLWKSNAWIKAVTKRLPNPALVSLTEQTYNTTPVGYSGDQNENRRC